MLRRAMARRADRWAVGKEKKKTLGNRGKTRKIRKKSNRKKKTTQQIMAGLSGERKGGKGAALDVVDAIGVKI